MSHYEKTLDQLDQLAALRKTKPLSIGNALDKLKLSSFDFLCILLCVPFSLPFSLGPLSAMGGLTFAALGWQMAKQQSKPWLPGKIRNIELPTTSWSVLLGSCRRVLVWGHTICRPRLQHWVNGARAEQFRGILICLAGLLMAIPFMGIPFNNTLPALAILFACLADLEDDGLMLLVSLFWLAATVVYFGLIIWVIFYMGDTAWQWMREHGMGWLVMLFHPADE